MKEPDLISKASFRTHIFESRSRGARSRSTVYIFIAIIIFLSAGYYFLITAPLSFPKETTITIESGSTLRDISQFLEENSIVRSEVALQTFSILLGGDKSVDAGDYYFEKRIPVFSVARRLSSGEHNLGSVKVTIPEGYMLKEMAEVYSESLAYFDIEMFLELTKEKEGYLFPDTYFFFQNAEASHVVSAMESIFKQKIAPFEDEIKLSGKTLDEILTMASIIEKETRNGEDSRRTVSGILWKRMDHSIPLQVDAVFLYINGKGSFDLTLSDLREDHPYNTYTNLGLPPGPIGNPGIDSIEAALRPVNSPYWYYLHDNSGQIHYGRTFEEHKANKRRYLK